MLPAGHVPEALHCPHRILLFPLQFLQVVLAWGAGAKAKHVFPGGASPVTGRGRVIVSINLSPSTKHSCSASFAMNTCCWIILSLASPVMPRYFLTGLLLSQQVPALYQCPWHRDQHLPLLDTARFLLAWSSGFSRFFCIEALLLTVSTIASP